MVFVQHLQHDVGAGRNHKARRAIGLHRHDAMLHLERQMGGLGDACMLLVVFIATPAAACRPRPRHLLENAQVGRLAARHVLQPVIDITDHAQRLVFRRQRLVHRHGSHRRGRARPHRIGQPARDRAIPIERGDLAAVIEQAQAIAIGRMPRRPCGLVRNQEQAVR